MHVFSHAVLLIFLLLSFFYFVFILIHLVSWLRLPVILPQTNYSSKTRITVIIPARNEEKSIDKCLNAIIAQTYPVNLMEIIVVDDHSTDKTKEVAERVLSKITISYKIISNGEHQQGKKSAITEGIKNATGELMVITDADCQSNSQWLSIIESEYKKAGAYMLCGPVGILSKSGFLSRFQGLEQCGLSLLSGAGIKVGIPLLSNGADIAYTRKVFDEVEGFKGIDVNPSGDDILLMFKVHKKYPGKISYVKSSDAVVSTSAQLSLSSFLSQRIRWASKGLSSKNSANSIISLLVFGVNFLSLLAILFIIVKGKLIPLLVLGVSLKIIADFLLLLFATAFFGKKKLLWIFLFAEIFTMFYISWVGIAANFASYNWKGRVYKHSK